MCWRVMSAEDPLDAQPEQVWVNRRDVTHECNKLWAWPGREGWPNVGAARCLRIETTPRITEPGKVWHTVESGSDGQPLWRWRFGMVGLRFHTPEANPMDDPMDDPCGEGA